MEFSALFDGIPRRYPEIHGRVAIVTGSGRGIGKGVAVRLAREGARVVINSRTETAVDETVRELRAVGAEAIGVPADLSTDEGRDRVFQACSESFGDVDILVNNAAILRRRPLFEVETSLLDQELQTNVRAAYLCSLRAAEQMRGRARGHIINVSSVGGLRAHWPGLPYDITKGAMDSMTRAMALDLAEYGISVNALAPGATYNKGLVRPEEMSEKVRTGIPRMRISDPLEMGGIVAFLCSDDAAYITGQVIYADGGITIQLGTRVHPL